MERRQYDNKAVLPDPETKQEAAELERLLRGELVASGRIRNLDRATAERIMKVLAAAAKEES